MADYHPPIPEGANGDVANKALAWEIIRILYLSGVKAQDVDGRTNEVTNKFIQIYAAITNSKPIA